MGKGARLKRKRIMASEARSVMGVRESYRGGYWVNPAAHEGDGLDELADKAIAAEDFRKNYWYRCQQVVKLIHPNMGVYSYRTEVGTVYSVHDGQGLTMSGGASGPMEAWEKAADTLQLRSPEAFHRLMLVHEICFAYDGFEIDEMETDANPEV